MSWFGPPSFDRDMMQYLLGCEYWSGAGVLITVSIIGKFSLSVPTCWVDWIRPVSHMVAAFSFFLSAALSVDMVGSP